MLSRMPAFRLTIASTILGLLCVCQAQMPLKRQTPPLKFSTSTNGELALSSPFSVRMSGFQITEVPIEAHAGTFRITCSWQQATQLQMSITGAAGHGLPGRIGLASKMGQSPLTVDVQVE